VLDVHIAESMTKAQGAEDFAQQKASDTRSRAVCNLIKNPNDNQQYVIKIWAGCVGSSWEKKVNVDSPLLSWRSGPIRDDSPAWHD